MLHLRPSNSSNEPQLARLLSRFPDAVLLRGATIVLECSPRLSAYRGQLLSGQPHGTTIYAASFIRQRRIVIDSQLLARPRLSMAVLVHELFHFAWVRLGNTARHSFTELLSAEGLARARGELGESSAIARVVKAPDSEPHRPKAWKNFVCESFCDTASYLVTGTLVGDDPCLAKRWLTRRRRWFNRQGAFGWLL